VDLTGISTATATRSLQAPVQGMIYDPAELAAVVPVHFHPLTPQRYLMLFSRHWTDATVSESHPGAYTDYTEVLDPGWVTISSGWVREIPWSSYLIPGADAKSEGQGRFLTAACSRTSDYLYVLTADDNGNALVQHFHYNPYRDMMTQVAREYLEPITVEGTQVHFTEGIYLSGRFVVVIGSGTDGQVWLARKPWGRVGVTSVSDPGGTGEHIDTPVWQYAGRDGWSADPAEARQIPLSTVGPVSTAVLGGRRLVATVAADGDDRVAVIRRVDDLGPGCRIGPVLKEVALGSTDDGTYLGHTAALQQHLQASAGGLVVPYVTARLVAEGGASRIQVDWDVQGFDD